MVASGRICTATMPSVKVIAIAVCCSPIWVVSSALEAAWTVGDPHDEVHNAWAAKELFRDVCAATTVAEVTLVEFFA